MTSRRNFLKTSALAAGAAATGISIARGAHAQGQDIIKIGMIGTGSRCTGAAAQSLKSDPSVKLVAMNDIFQERIDAKRNYFSTQFADQYMVDDDHAFVGFDGYQKVIDSVDVVLIACASKFHPMYMEAAIKAGKHVFVEKPHAIDPVGVRRVEAAAALAKEKGVSVMSGLQSRWHKGWQETMKRIHDGQIGDIVAMQSMFLRGPYQLVGRGADRTETEYQFSNWYHFNWLSGDDVTQSLVHNVDRMSWAMQGEMPKWAFAVGGRSGSFGEVYGDMFDHSCVVYEYESGPRLYALCRTTVGCYNNSGDIIMGSKGTCNLGRCTIEGQNPWKYEGRGDASPYDIEQAELIKSVKSGVPVNCGDYMAKSTMVGVMGQIASFQGNAVTWDAAYNADFQYGPDPEDSNFETPPPSEPDETGNYPLPLVGLTRFIP
jgi:myo-inositol 2-dehydrogenase / D-chiro-inositol 1-dehydrogenase